MQDQNEIISYSQARENFGLEEQQYYLELAGVETAEILRALQEPMPAQKQRSKITKWLLGHSVGDCGAVFDS